MRDKKMVLITLFNSKIPMLCGVQSDRSYLLAVYKDAGCFISGPTVMGGGEDSEEAAMLLDLKSR